MKRNKDSQDRYDAALTPEMDLYGYIYDVVPTRDVVPARNELNLPEPVPAIATKSVSQIEQHGVSRRELLTRVGIAGAAAIPLGMPSSVLARASGAEPAHAQVPSATARAATAPSRFETLTGTESDILEAIVARIIPTDEDGPGAAEAHAADYIDRALGGPLMSFREAYSVGLAAVDSYAKASKGRPFVELVPADQDAVLSDMERNITTGFVPNSSTFFSILRAHTIQGTFCDPYHGGNANFVGWDLIGYPGIRAYVSPDEHRMDTLPTPNHKSAYDYPMFTKREYEP